MAELPSGTVTFLFTDLEGSTRLWEEHPDEMRSALARHDVILRESVASHRGAIVKSTGDGVHAVFASAHEALEAAVGAQRVLTAEAWPVVTPIRVRTGLHSGEAEFRDGDYFGTATNRAARLMSAAHGGQVLVSSSTESLLADDLPEGVGLIDLGEHRLRDLTRAEHVYQVVAGGIGGEFPPLRSLDAFPENLPLQVSSFVGRESEQAALAKALDGSRLVTVIGVGGVGKTRLAVQVAADVITRFPDGAWFCQLAAADDPEAMLEVVAAALGVQSRPGVTLDRSIVESLRARRLLVVLDNCEHVIRDVAQLAAGLLGECQTVWVLATSREALGVPGEQVWPLSALELPDGRYLDGAAANDSVRLFAERAVAARPGFELGATNVEAVVEICRRLDGIPLAIELAAARVGALSPSDIRGLLDERFRLLGGARRSSVARHQTLRATVDWSYSLLEEIERVVFERLGVFAGSFDARAAEVVCAGDSVEVWDVLDALTGLVAKSMVNADEAADGSMRYQLLETLRQYARERLEESDDIDRWRARHAVHYADVAEETLEGIDGGDELLWRPRLAADLDNIRAALSWSLDRDDADDVDQGLRIFVAIGDSIDTTMVSADWIDRAVQLAADRPPEIRARILGIAAMATALFGDIERARDLAYQAIDLEPTPHYQHAYGALAIVAFNDGHYDEAYRRCVEGLRALERSGDTRPSHRIGDYSAIATFATVAGDFDTARQYAETGLREAREVGNPSNLAFGLYGAGQGFRTQEPDRALAYFKESAALVRDGARHPSLGTNCAYLARLADERGDVPTALDALDQALEHFRRIGPRTEMIAVLAQMCRTFARNRPEPAAVLAGIICEGPIAHFGAAGTPERIARALTPARTQLTDDAYTELYRRGAAMSYAEAMDYARTQLQDAATTTRS
jgi:predicted ATPase/class 3 adenylate cyclase